MFAAVDTLDRASTTDDRRGAMLGTPGFMAPEQMRGDDVGPEADVYALGAMLFEILAGEPLHPPGKAAISSDAREADAVAGAAPHPTAASRPSSTRVCVAALAEAKDKRPSARELADRVQRYLDGDRDLERRKRSSRASSSRSRARHSRSGDESRRSRAGREPRPRARSRIHRRGEARLAADPRATDRQSRRRSRHVARGLRDRAQRAARQERDARILSLWMMLPVFLFMQT